MVTIFFFFLGVKGLSGNNFITCKVVGILNGVKLVVWFCWFNRKTTNYLFIYVRFH